MASTPEKRFKNAKIYTEEEFVTAAKNSGYYDKFGQADLDLARQNPNAGMQLLKFKQYYDSAPAGEAGDAARSLARAAAENLRAEYGGYATSADGMAVVPLSSGKKTGSGVLSIKGQKGQPAANTLQSGFGDLYKNYEQTIRDAQAKVQQDIVGQMAALTGGYGSSSAATKAAAAGADFARLLAEKKIELEKEEYDRKLSEAQFAASLGDFSLLRALGIDTTQYEAALASEGQQTTSEDTGGAVAVGYTNAQINQALSEAKAGRLSEYGKKVVDSVYGEGYYERNFGSAGGAVLPVVDEPVTGNEDDAGEDKPVDDESGPTAATERDEKFRRVKYDSAVKKARTILQTEGADAAYTYLLSLVPNAEKAGARDLNTNDVYEILIELGIVEEEE